MLKHRIGCLLIEQVVMALSIHKVYEVLVHAYI